MKTFLFTVLILVTWSTSAKVVERVMAVVEGEMILKSDLKAFSSKFKKKALVNENLISLLKLKSSASEKELLDYLISKQIILSLAKKGTSSSDNDLAENEMLKLAQQNNITVEQLKKEIISRGIPLKDYKAFIAESSLIRSALEKNVISQVRPSEEDFVSYLKQNGVSGIQSSHSYTLEQIFIPKENPDAQTLLSAINSDNFRVYFLSPEKYGLESLDLGKLQDSDLSRKHRLKISTLSEGDLSDPLEEDGGYRIFYLKDKKNDFKIPNTPQVQNLQRQFYESKISSYFDLWFNEIKNDFFVRKNDL